MANGVSEVTRQKEVGRMLSAVIKTKVNAMQKDFIFLLMIILIQCSTVEFITTKTFNQKL